MKFGGLKFYLALFVCCGVFGGVAFIASRHADALLQRDSSSASYWKSRISQIGGASAYAELTANVSALDPSTQHLDAHTFGGALFDIEGLSGISVCDDRFSYGCYHEFIGQALLADGLSVLPTMRTACNKSKAPTPCLHGIGHGLLAYFGYGPADLQKAADICAEVAPVSRQGCFGGAFMEYNIRTMTGLYNVRPLDDALFAPCDMFSGAVAESCMYYQPQWWWSVLPEGKSSDKSVVFTRMVSLCRGRLEQRACLEGVGLMVPASVSYDSVRAISLCKDVTDSLNEDAYCASGAAFVFAGTSREVQAQAVCASLTEEGSLFCTQYITGGIDAALPSLSL